MGTTVIKKRFFEKRIIIADKKERKKILKKLMKQNFEITIGLLKRGRFKIDPLRIKIVAEREVTKNDVTNSLQEK